MSEHATLFEALLAFQENAPALQKDATNPHFRNKYVSLDSLTQTITPLLAAQKLVWMTRPCFHEGVPALRYTLAHAPSKETIEDVMPLMLAKEDSQGQGSALTYARRYAISAVLGLSAEDDDGGRASKPSAPAGDKPASDAQQRVLFAKASEANLDPAMFANVLLLTAKREPILFETEDEAQAWVDRALPKFPARLVKPAIDNMQKEKP